MSRPLLVWLAWGCIWAVATWMYLWSVGAWTIQWTDLPDLLPLVVAASLSALIIDHFGIAGWRMGLAVLIVTLCLIPAVDLLVRPGCAGLEAIELYREEDGSVETRCTATADMRREGVSAMVGLIAVGGLAGVLVRRRRRAGP